MGKLVVVSVFVSQFILFQAVSNRMEYIIYPPILMGHLLPLLLEKSLGQFLPLCYYVFCQSLASRSALSTPAQSMPPLVSANSFKVFVCPF